MVEPTFEPGEVSVSPETLRAQLREWLEWARKEQENLDRQLREIELMAEKSRAEVERLGQRSASMQAYLRQAIQRGRLEEAAKHFESALETQQRFLLVRSQVEKLDSDKAHLERYRELLMRFLEALENVLPLLGDEEGDRTSSEALVRMVIQAEQNVRRRVARQMHDGPAQTLSNLILQAEIVRRIFDRDPKQALAELETLQKMAQQSFRKVRMFITELRPMALDDLGLTPTIQRYLSTLQQQIGIETDIKYVGNPRRLEGFLEMLAFRVVQEAIHETTDRGQPQRVSVLLDFQDPRSLFLRVRTEGLGLDELPPEPQTDELRLLKEQVDRLGGRLSIQPRPGEGREVEVRIPTGS